MKTRNKVLLAVLVLLAIGFAATAWRNENERKSEAQYHAKLTNSIQVSSQSFKMDGAIPVVFTCKGEGVSPDLSWEGAPANTTSYALVVTDPDTPVGIFTHWLLYNIPNSEKRIPERVSNAELGQKKIMVGKFFGVEGYQGPCPPYGTHRYVFRVYALDMEQLLPASTDRQDVLKRMEGHVLAYGELVGRFGD